MGIKHEQQLEQQGFVTVSNDALQWPRRHAFQRIVDAGKAKAVQHSSYTLYTWIDTPKRERNKPSGAEVDA